VLTISSSDNKDLIQ